MRRKQGKVIVPYGALVQPHELVVASVLSWSGEDVIFIPVGRYKTADIVFRGLEWEIKSPKGSSSRTIENNMRAASKQSENVIIDLARIKISEDKAVNEIQRQVFRMRGIRRLLIITKKRKILEIIG